jgi:hypothetical protein
MASPADVGGAVAVTVLIVGASSGVYAQFGPSMFTISSDFFHENGKVEGNKKRIRHAEILGTIITLGMGWAGSVLTKSPIPLVGSALYSAASIGAWEYSMAHPAKTTG